MISIDYRQGERKFDVHADKGGHSIGTMDAATERYGIFALPYALYHWAILNRSNRGMERTVRDMFGE